MVSLPDNPEGRRPDFRSLGGTMKTVEAVDYTDDLVGDWVGRVMTLWEQCREPDQTVASWQISDLTESCLVRDQINNRLRSRAPELASSARFATALLTSADKLFAQFTHDAQTSDALAMHNHYAHQSEWWWKRIPTRSLTADVLASQPSPARLSPTQSTAQYGAAHHSPLPD
jgi:hypothetical protein